MYIHPSIKTLFRNKASVLVIVCEIALCFAILCNSGHLIGRRIERMSRPTGLVDDEISRIYLTEIGKDSMGHAEAAADLRVIRSVPGVKGAEAMNVIPFGGSSYNSDVSADAERKDKHVNASIYMGGPELVKVWGLDIIKGRGFERGEFVSESELMFATADVHIPATIVSRAFCEALFADQDCVGKAIYAWGRKPHKIVGVVDRLLRPNDMHGAKAEGYVLIFPIVGKTPHYAIRSAPEDRTRVLEAAVNALLTENPNRLVVHRQTFRELIDRWYQRDRSMIWLLTVTCALLLLVTGFGIVGMVSFWVQQRKRQIGVRRALGASQGDIMRQFQLENLVLMLIGVGLGSFLAIALNQVLMHYYEVNRIPAALFALAGVVVLGVGQLAVWWPAYRASSVPPATATRSV